MLVTAVRLITPPELVLGVSGIDSDNQLFSMKNGDLHPQARLFYFWLKSLIRSMKASTIHNIDYYRIPVVLKTKIMRIFYILFVLLIPLMGLSQNKDDYLKEVKAELIKEWPNNNTINLVFHGHSVPAGYFKTPVVNTLDSYPYQLLEKLKERYPHAVINIIITAIGGENSKSGNSRFKKEVLTHRPDVVFIDYALNDLGIGLDKANKAWTKMIKTALGKGIKVILLTPSPDQRISYDDPGNELKKHADQIIKLASEHQVGLVDSYKAFEFTYSEKEQLSKYMSQVNHPNKLGHELIANEIINWF